MRYFPLRLIAGFFVLTGLPFSGHGAEAPSPTLTCPEILGALTQSDGAATAIAQRYHSLRGKSQGYDPQTLSLWNATRDRHGFLFGRIDGDAEQDLVFFMSVGDLERSAFDADFAQALAKEADQPGRPISAKILSRNSKLLLTAHFLESIPAGSKFLSEDQFRAIARLEDIEIKTIPRSFRLDSRPPDAIMADQGLLPNPQKKLGSFLEHSDPRSPGRRFVSLSTKEGNDFNLLIGPILFNARPLAKERLHPALLAKAEERVFKHEMRLLETFEYQVLNQAAALPLAEASVAGEAEVIVSHVSASHISASRRVQYVVDIAPNPTGGASFLELVGAHYDDWQPMPHPK